MFKRIHKTKTLILVVVLVITAGGAVAYTAIPSDNATNTPVPIDPTASVRDLAGNLYKYQLEAWKATYKRRYKGASIREAWSAVKLAPQTWQAKLRLTIMRKGRLVRKLPIAKWRIDLPLDNPPVEGEMFETKDKVFPHNNVARKYARFPKAPTSSSRPKYRMRLKAMDVDKKRDLVFVLVLGESDQEPYLTWKRGFDWSLLRTINLMENIKIPDMAELRVGSKTKFRRAFYRENGEPPRRYERSSFSRFAKYVSKNSLADVELTWRASRKTTLRGLLRTRPRYITTQESER